MSSQEQYIRTEYPVIDSDPHFSRVVRYMRGSDYVAWGALTAGGPAVLLALDWGEEDDERDQCYEDYLITVISNTFQGTPGNLNDRRQGLGCYSSSHFVRD
ncbi:hypothetical protein BGZ54_003339, partial [Gamsiella multidivaricata]